MKSKRKFVAIIVLAFLCFALSAYAADGTVTINASSFVRAIPETLHGTNTQCWDGAQNGGNENFNNLMAASGRRYVRWPGGSWGDAYLWSDMESGESQTWIVSYDESMYWINKTGSIMQPIVNFPGYWYNTDHNDACAYDAAVAWVRDQSSRIPSARYWEIGNETGGFWEAGFFVGISGTYYGDQFANFCLAMKAVNNQIKLGADAEPSNRYGNGGSQDYVGYWDHDLLLAAQAKGVVPDFFIIHQYPGTNQGTSYNTTMLGSRIDDIGQASTNFTTSMNTIITNSIGAQYVGKIKYWMTEWDAGGTSSYERYKTYLNLMFQSQYIMEMAKFGWEGSNPWSQNEYYYSDANHPNFYVFPKWYVSPLLKNYFGRDMVYTTDTLTRVRAYAARDDANNLTIFMVNNYPLTDLVVTINITDFTTDTTGQSWLVQPAGGLISGGANIQDYNDIMINGVVHPNPLAIATLPGVPMAVSNSFDVNLPRSALLFIKIPPANPTDQLPYGGTPWAIPGTIEAEDYDTGGQFIAYYDTDSGNSGGQYRSDDVDIETCSEGGYDVNGIYPGEWLEYTVVVETSGIYKVTARVASADANGQFRIEFDGQDVTGPVTFPPTGDMQTFTDVDVNKVFLYKGPHTMRLLMDSAGWNINYLTFSKVGGGTGKALREWWTGIGGSAVSNLTSNANYPYSPTGRERARSFEGPTNWTNTSGTQLDNYGTRIRGYLHPIADGNYTFWIASDDASELWFSNDSNPDNKTRIAKVSNYVNPYKWDKNAEQKSATFTLLAGQSYYIEALHKEGSGGDSIEVAWEGPGIIRQTITAQYLTPVADHELINFMDFADFADQWQFVNCIPGNIWCSEADYDRDGTITLDDFMQFVDNFWLTAAE